MFKFNSENEARLQELQGLRKKITAYDSELTHVKLAAVNGRGSDRLSEDQILDKLSPWPGVDEAIRIANEVRDRLKGSCSPQDPEKFRLDLAVPDQRDSIWLDKIILSETISVKSIVDNYIHAVESKLARAVREFDAVMIKF